MRNMTGLFVIMTLLIGTTNAMCGWKSGKYYNGGRIIFEFKDTKTDIYDADDKGFHLCGGYILNQHFDKRMTWGKSFLVVQLLSFAWEIKDGFVSHRDVPLLGGNGFSYKDHLAVTVGQLGQYLLDHVLFNNSPMQGDETLRKIQNKNLYVELNPQKTHKSFVKKHGETDKKEKNLIMKKE